MLVNRDMVKIDPLFSRPISPIAASSNPSQNSTTCNPLQISDGWSPSQNSYVFNPSQNCTTCNPSQNSDGCPPSQVLLVAPACCWNSLWPCKLSVAEWVYQFELTHFFINSWQLTQIYICKILAVMMESIIYSSDEHR